MPGWLPTRPLGCAGRWGRLGAEDERTGPMYVCGAGPVGWDRPGARGAVLCYSALPLGKWGDNWPATWPDGVGLQLHILKGDEDLEIAQALAATVPGAEFFVYPGTEHYFAERDDQAAALLTQRVLAFLG